MGAARVRSAPPRALAFAFAVATLCMASPRASSAQGFDAWADGRQWIMVRAGYAKAAAEGAADGSVGGGFAYQRFLTSKWAVGAAADINLLGKFGASAEIESPWVVEATRHYQWPTILRPYLGLGVGAIWHKYYRTGEDAASLQLGVHATFGANMAISERSLLGLDLRMTVADLDKHGNPVFYADTDGEPERVLRWSAKLGYAWAF